jgi:DNA-binding GntR family transcriptional regulator
MVRAALEMLREAGLLEIEGAQWRLAPVPTVPLELEALGAYRPYQAAHAFRLALANGTPDEVRALLMDDRAAALAR